MNITWARNGKLTGIRTTYLWIQLVGILSSDYDSIPHVITIKEKTEWAMQWAKSGLKHLELGELNHYKLQISFSVRPKQVEVSSSTCHNVFFVVPHL